MGNNTTNLRYITCPTRFVNTLRSISLESLHRSTFHFTDFDISTAGIGFLAKDESSCTGQPTNVNAYYIPLITFTEVSRPQTIKVTGFKGRNSHPVFSRSGDSVALLKRPNLADSYDRSRVIVVNNMRNFPAPMAIEDMSMQQSGEYWLLSPFSVAWSDDG